MNVITYTDILKSIPENMYQQYRIRIDRTSYFVPLEKFVEDISLLSNNLSSKYHSLDLLTEHMTKLNPSLILQKTCIHHISEMGFDGDIGNICFESFEDIAPYVITDEIELYKKFNSQNNCLCKANEQSQHEEH